MELVQAALIYNALMLGVDAIALLGLLRWRTAIGWIASFLTVALLALVLAVAVTGFHLRTASLLAMGWFGHLSLLGLVSAVLLARRDRGLAIAGCLTAATAIALAVYMFFVEPFQLEVTTYRIATPKVSQTTRIALLADFQTDRFGSYERKVIDRLQELNPDLILCAGDYLQPSTARRHRQLCEALNAYFHEVGFSAPGGIYAVQGNSDDFEPWQKIFDGLPVTVFDSTRSVPATGLTITGLSPQDSFDTQLRLESQPGFHIVLGHAPDFALGEIEADLLLAGHTHGGQIRLPGIGPLVTLSAVPRSWAAGLTKLDSERRLIVSRGVGMERYQAPRIRFLCRPQLVEIILEPAS